MTKYLPLDKTKTQKHSSDISYIKYMKYKKKYLRLKQQNGGEGGFFGAVTGVVKGAAGAVTGAVTGVVGSAINQAVARAGYTCESYYSDDPKYSTNTYKFKDFEVMEKFLTTLGGSPKYTDTLLDKIIKLGIFTNINSPKLKNCGLIYLLLNIKLKKSHLLEMFCKKGEIKGYIELLCGDTLQSFVDEEIIKSIINILSINKISPCTKYNTDKIDDNLWHSLSKILELITCLRDNLNPNNKFFKLAENTPILKSKLNEIKDTINFVKINQTLNESIPFKFVFLESLLLNNNDHTNNSYPSIFDEYNLVEKGYSGLDTKEKKPDHKQYKDFTLQDFLDKSKNTECILPSFVLVLLSIKINETINDKKDYYNIMLREYMQEYLVECGIAKTQAPTPESSPRKTSRFSFSLSFLSPKSLLTKFSNELSKITEFTKMDSITSSLPDITKYTDFNYVFYNLYIKMINFFLADLQTDICNKDGSKITWDTFNGLFNILNKIIKILNTKTKDYLMFKILEIITPIFTFIPFDISLYINKMIGYKDPFVGQYSKQIETIFYDSYTDDRIPLNIKKKYNMVDPTTGNVDATKEIYMYPIRIKYSPVEGKSDITYDYDYTEYAQIENIANPKGNTITVKDVKDDKDVKSVDIIIKPQDEKQFKNAFTPPDTLIPSIIELIIEKRDKERIFSSSTLIKNEIIIK